MKKTIISLTALAMFVSAATHAEADTSKKTDFLLIGGGIMSASLGTWLQALQPDWDLTMVEKLDGVALESSNGWNNAGTGHSANMELNYTPERADGSIDVSKALDINEQFMISRQFWSAQVKRGILHDPHSFINSTPHMSFVWGDNVDYLQKRYNALQQTTLFQGMKFSTDHAQIKQWAPLVMEGRDPQQKVAATWTPVGTDVNYGEITRQLIGSLKKNNHFTLQTSSEVTDFKRNADNSWHVTIKNVQSGEAQTIDAKYVFIGAGGGALKLLQKTGIPEADNYAGFPVGGSFLMTENPAVTAQHLEKVYSQASVGAPITLNVLKQMFPQQFNSPEWQSRIHAIVPSYGQKLNGNVALTQQVWDDTAATLQLTKPPVIQMPAAAPTATAKPAETPREASPQHDMAL